MKEIDIYKYVEKEAKKYGFKCEKYGTYLHLDGRFELKTGRGNVVRNTDYYIEFEDMSKRPGTQKWGGTISKIHLSGSHHQNIIKSTFEAWIKSIFELEELQPYARALKVKKIKKLAGDVSK